MSVVPKDSALNKAGGEDDNVHIRGQEHGSYFESANLSSSRDNCKSFQMSLMEVHNYMLIKKIRFCAIYEHYFAQYNKTKLLLIYVFMVVEI